VDYTDCKGMEITGLTKKGLISYLNLFRGYIIDSHKVFVRSTSNIKSHSHK